MHVSINGLLEVVLLVGLGASTWYYLTMMYSAGEFMARREPLPPSDELPPMTVLKPLKGLDPELYENLASLCEQDYGEFQVICGVADAADPAVAVVRQLQAAYPHVDVELIVDARIYGTNYKISNLHNMYRHAKHDVIVLADSDIRVGRRCLRRLAARLRHPGVGLVTCSYRAVNKGGFSTLPETLFINTDFFGMIMVARKVERAQYAFGATIALRRAVLDEIGGFLPLANQLADDYQLGNRVAALGYELALSEDVVDTVVAVGTWQRLFQHQLRWARTYRICRPGGYFASILTHGTLWAVLNVLYNRFSPMSVAASLGVIGLRYLAAAVLSWRHLHANTRWYELLLVGPKDLLISTIWFLAFLGDTVWWSGRRFRVLPNGELLDLTPGAATPAVAWPRQSEVES